MKKQAKTIANTVENKTKQWKTRQNNGNTPKQATSQEKQVETIDNPGTTGRNKRQ